GGDGHNTLTIGGGSLQSLKYVNFQTVTDNADTVDREWDAPTLITTFTVSRDPATAKIQITDSSNNVLASFNDPSGSLTIIGNYNYNTITVQALTLNADLTVDGLTGADSITVTGNLTVPGYNLTLRAVSIDIQPGVILST